MEPWHVVLEKGVWKGKGEYMRVNIKNNVKVMQLDLELD
jgi:hypothetical protein